MQAMTGTYPVASYLHKIGKAASKLCQHCSSGVKETLSHFLSVCPRFHDVRTAAHNQIRSRLSSSLKRHLPRKWKLYEEAAMLRTGLRMRPVSSARVRETGRCVSEADLEAGRMSLSLESVVGSQTLWLCPSRLRRLLSWSCVDLLIHHLDNCRLNMSET